MKHVLNFSMSSQISSLSLTDLIGDKHRVLAISMVQTVEGDLISGVVGHIILNYEFKKFKYEEQKVGYPAAQCS